MARTGRNREALARLSRVTFRADMDTGSKHGENRDLAAGQASEAFIELFQDGKKRLK